MTHSPPDADAPESPARGRRRATQDAERPAQVVIAGWNELVALPDWKIRALHAKLDTGARTSALHVEDLEELPGGRVSFYVRLHRRLRDRRVHVIQRVARRARVRSSNGHYTHRIFVATTLRLGPIERRIELSLVDREEMLFRMLIGRTALAGAVLVDAARRRLLIRPPRRKSKSAREPAPLREPKATRAPKAQRESKAPQKPRRR
jgi:hypothetical protein